MGEKEPKKLKKAVIREELVALTGCYKKAITLSQMLYWSERVRDYDKFLAEEKERAESEEDPILNIEETHGWIYKTAKELSEETMLGVKPATMLKYLDFMVEKGWLDRRNNPKYKWDKTYQYRLNIVKLQEDLHDIGYSLPGYEVIKNRISKNETQSSKNENQNSENEIQVSKNEKQYQKLPSEIISENTIENTPVYSSEKMYPVPNTDTYTEKNTTDIKNFVGDIYKFTDYKARSGIKISKEDRERAWKTFESLPDNDPNKILLSNYIEHESQKWDFSKTKHKKSVLQGFCVEYFEKSPNAKHFMVCAKDCKLDEDLEYFKERNGLKKEEVDDSGQSIFEMWESTP